MTKPSQITVFFEREAEIRFDYAPSSAPRADSPTLENVLPEPPAPKHEEGK